MRTRVHRMFMSLYVRMWTCSSHNWFEAVFCSLRFVFHSRLNNEMINSRKILGRLFVFISLIYSINYSHSLNAGMFAFDLFIDDVWLFNQQYSLQQLFQVKIAHLESHVLFSFFGYVSLYFLYLTLRYYKAAWNKNFDLCNVNRNPKPRTMLINCINITQTPLEPEDSVYAK